MLWTVEIKPGAINRPGLFTSKVPPVCWLGHDGQFALQTIPSFPAGAPWTIPVYWKLAPWPMLPVGGEIISVMCTFTSELPLVVLSSSDTAVTTMLQGLTGTSVGAV